MRQVRIGAGQGFYGDTVTAAVDMIERGDVSYVCFDALSELTLAILQKDRQRDPSLGFTRDLLPWMKRLLPLARPRGIKLVTNAGGLNPRGAAEGLRDLARSLRLDGLKIGFVTGDDAREHGPPDALFGCAYLGARPVVEALARGCDLIVTGRVADSALFLAPAVHELEWAWDDWDRLAVGTVAGHLLECSGQATGGNFSGDWASVPEPWRLGYPLAEITADGRLTIAKPPGTGGLVTPETVSEQLLYEIHDPARYIVPDVVVDLSDTWLEAAGPDEVRVHGVKGHPRPPTLKVLGAQADGWMGEGRVGYTWPRAYEKARRAAEILGERIALARIPVLETRVEYQGRDSLLGLPPAAEPDEVFLRYAVRTATREEAERATREMPYLGLNGPPGVSGYSGVTPPRQLLSLWQATVPRDPVEARVTVEVLEA